MLSQLPGHTHQSRTGVLRRNGSIANAGKRGLSADRIRKRATRKTTA